MQCTEGANCPVQNRLAAFRLVGPLRNSHKIAADSNAVIGLLQGSIQSPINFFDSICVAQPGWVQGITEFRCEAKGFAI